MHHNSDQYANKNVAYIDFKKYMLNFLDWLVYSMLL